MGRAIAWQLNEGELSCSQKNLSQTNIPVRNPQLAFHRYSLGSEGKKISGRESSQKVLGEGAQDDRTEVAS